METEVIFEKTKLGYRPQEAAKVLGVSRPTIYRMIAEGKLVAKKLGASTIIHHSELDRVLNGAPLSDATKRAQASIK